MTVECNEFEYCKVKVNYIAKSEVVKEKRGEVISYLRKAKVKVPGFRPGKASDLAIKIKCKKQLNDLLKKEMVGEAYDETLFETKMKPISYPEIHSLNLDGNNFSCEMTFLKKPEFELKQYKEFEIPKPHQHTSARELAEQIIQQLRIKHADPVPYGPDDIVEFGDQLTLDVIAKDANDEMDSLSQKGAFYTVGQNPIKEIDQKICGMKAGEEREFDIIFDEDEKYPDNIRGKRIKFVVKVHMGTKRYPLSLDDKLAKKVGVDTYDKLRKQAESTASAQLEQNQKQQIADQIFKRLLEEHDFEVPMWYILMEGQKGVMQLGLNWDELTEEQIDGVNKQAKDKIKLSLIFDAIRDNEPDVSFSDQEMLERIHAQLVERGQDAGKIIAKFSKDGTLTGTIAALKDKATIQWLVDNCKIVE